MEKVYALVLAGGGAKGSYQIGVWKALKELGIKFNAVFGTSVGAINSALIIEGNLKKSIKLWKEIKLDNIVVVPKELRKNGKLNFNLVNFESLKKLQKIFLVEKGLDTTPLKNLLRANINEKKIRKAKIDFGLVTYDITSYKTKELFLEDIPQGQLIDFIAASASIPFIFQSTVIKGKRFIDGGVYNNIPFGVAKNRGYKNIIVIEIAGLGINKKMEFQNTNLIYIKNSIEMGNILDFSSKFLKDYMNLGYLDALKIFQKIDGIKYFYKNDFKIFKQLENLIFKKDFIDDLKMLLNIKKTKKNEEKNFKEKIIDILPPDFKENKNIIASLAECAALSIGMEINHNYNSFENFINTIWKKYNEMENHGLIENKGSNFFDYALQSIRKGNDIKKFIKTSIVEYEKILALIFKKEKKELESMLLTNTFPNIKPAKIFFMLLKKYYFKNNNILKKNRINSHVKTINYQLNKKKP